MLGAQLFQLVRSGRIRFIIGDIRQQSVRGVTGKTFTVLPWFTQMASGEPGSTRKHRLEKNISSGSPSRSSNNQVGQDNSDPDFGFVGDHVSRRPSTTEDEQRVKGLLKEILALKEKNVSSWVVEVRLSV